ncbi:hypothetical protein CCYA_CCYA06G1914 [Cyanidiococcus yangmingshanensis]|nr:hypothetical protein CCYA_CCYA06G1914 [Cyanidiococcus yangmingshanensis]
MMMSRILTFIAILSLYFFLPVVALSFSKEACTTWPSWSVVERWWQTGDTRCLRLQLARLLGYGVVAGAALVKLPQLWRILESHSAAGISITTYLVESFGYAYNLAYHYRAGYPFSTYGDFALLGVQNCAIMALIFYYGGQWFPQGLLTLLLFLGGTVLASWKQGPVPLAILERLCSLNIAIVIGSRLPQIFANTRRKHTGSLSLTTCVGLFGGAVARVFTTLQQVQNSTILLGYLASAFLNGLLVIQIFLYRERTKAVMTGTSRNSEAIRIRSDKTKQN